MELSELGQDHQFCIACKILGSLLLLCRMPLLGTDVNVTVFFRIIVSSLQCTNCAHFLMTYICFSLAFDPPQPPTPYFGIQWTLDLEGIFTN